MIKGYYYIFVGISVFSTIAYGQKRDALFISTKDNYFVREARYAPEHYSNKVITYDSKTDQFTFYERAKQPTLQKSYESEKINQQSDYTFSAIFTEDSDEYHWNFNVDWETFQAAIDTLVAQGFRMESLNTYGSDDFLYASTWVQDTTAWILNINIDNDDDFFAFLDNLTAGDNNYKPIDFAIHPLLNETLLYSAIGVEQPEEAIFSLIFNADRESFETWINDKYANGAVLIELEVYSLPGFTQAFFAGIVEAGQFNQQATWQRNEDDFLSFNDDMIEQSMVLKELSTYRVGSDIFYAGYWNSAQELFGWSIGFTAGDVFVSAINNHETNNLRPVEFANWDNNTPTVSVQSEDGLLPNSVQLTQNYPNPFNPETTINYTLPEAGFVRLEIYNMTGQKVKTLVSASQIPGAYNLKWRGNDESGNPVASGLYMYKLTLGEFTTSRKMLFLK